MPPATTDPAIQEEISAREWAWVESLIRDVAEQERRDHFLATFYRWEMAIRELHKREWETLEAETPTKADLQHHKECLERLIEIGGHVCQEANRCGDAFLKPQGFTVADVEAMHAQLDHTWATWHEPHDPATIEAIKQRIFNGPA
jgi:hypothetical protein